MTEWKRALAVEELAPGRARSVRFGETQVAVCQVGQDYFAIHDLCTHDGGALDQGELVEDRIECPRHGAWFNVRTGKVLSLPAVRDIRTFPVKVEAGQIYVEV
jgi:3-phenylpropionate/trans-cinnamate dioxygenase ferredoxin subunit